MFLARCKAFLLVYPLCREVYESSENNYHLRDGRKTLHRSVFFFALSNPLQILKQKNTAHRLVYRVFGALQGIRTPDLLVRSFGLNELLKITACYQML